MFVLLYKLEFLNKSNRTNKANKKSNIYFDKYILL